MAMQQAVVTLAQTAPEELEDAELSADGHFVEESQEKNLVQQASVAQ